MSKSAVRKQRRVLKTECLEASFFDSSKQWRKPIINADSMPAREQTSNAQLSSTSVTPALTTGACSTEFSTVIDGIEVHGSIDSTLSSAASPLLVRSSAAMDKITAVDNGYSASFEAANTGYSACWNTLTEYSACWSNSQSSSFTVGARQAKP